MTLGRWHVDNDTLILSTAGLFTVNHPLDPRQVYRLISVIHLLKSDCMFLGHEVV